ncbi:MAG: HAMP domain-containing protein [Anaerolineae bacterium]|nr:HAMP domain-containing protein [Anaerolineae bacterium]
MTRPLAVKLVLAFMAVSLAGIVLVAILARRISGRAFETVTASQSVLNLADSLADYYARTGSWTGVEELVIERAGPGMGGGQGRRFALAEQEGRILVPGAGYPRQVRLNEEQLAVGVPIVVRGEQVGTLLVGGTAHAAMMGTQPRTQFEANLIPGLGLAALGAAAFAAVLGVVLARNLTRPLQELTAATRAVAKGELGVEVPVRSQDEIGELAYAFNQMNGELARGRQLRRQMTADIAHELRTPLSLILGHAEALQEGVLPPTPETFAIIHDEARRLNRLVDDLRTLSLVDAGELPLRLRPSSSQEILTSAAASFRPYATSKQVELLTEIEPDLPDLLVDPDRMAQVVGNLLANALRYTPERGRVVLRAHRHPEGVQWQVQDSGPGIAPEQLPHLFDRFYKADKARERGEAGSGLGLAIARSLVEAHRGRLWAESQPGYGATFCILLENS